MKAFVYFNLHTKLWSVKALDGEHAGKVVCHAERVELAECEFRVSEAGRQRVLREQRKNVHAGVVGSVVSLQGGAWRIPEADDGARCMSPVHPYNLRNRIGGHPVSYNPYKGATFVRHHKRFGTAPIHYARHVTMRVASHNLPMEVLAYV